MVSLKRIVRNSNEGRGGLYEYYVALYKIDMLLICQHAHYGMSQQYGTHCWRIYLWSTTCVIDDKETSGELFLVFSKLLPKSCVNSHNVLRSLLSSAAETNHKLQYK